MPRRRNRLRGKQPTIDDFLYAFSATQPRFQFCTPHTEAFHARDNCTCRRDGHSPTRPGVQDTNKIPQFPPTDSDQCSGQEHVAVTFERISICIYRHVAPLTRAVFTHKIRTCTETLGMRTSASWRTSLSVDNSEFSSCWN